jgi:hypothetical protein
MCPSGATCLPADCCFSELALWKSNSACWSCTKRNSSSSHWKLTCSRHDKEKEQTGWLGIRIMCPKWSDMSTRRLLFQWASPIKSQLNVLVLYKAELIIISLKIHLFSPWYSWKIAELALNNNHPLTLLPVDYDISPLLIINFQILKL